MVIIISIKYHYFCIHSLLKINKSTSFQKLQKKENLDYHFIRSYYYTYQIDNINIFSSYV